MSGWGEFLLALGVFLLSHAIPVRPPVRPWLIAHLGRVGYFTAYSLFSLAVLGWLILAAARAPYVEVIPPLPALRWVPLLVMPVVCWLAAAGMSIRNPLSFGGLGRAPFDPDRPGILRVSRHPILLALLLWALAHLLANGSLAHVILFGLFAGFAVMGMALIDRRKARELGQEWQRLSRNTARLSLSAPKPWPRPWVWLAALVAYAALLHLHAPVIGLSPLP
ncbi:NnrU family protein [Ruegeria marisrubri]|uniref:NnrU family protein n=1 Tax=Ruegeria marisrubri TaxID=1685379 RepID=A0A0X3TME7_9RHOB|nr:NnrU family protein [Ruegeria marisrubri]KUJ76918.1 NnrU family protein [Ruegeria marisrubri]